MTAPFSPLWTDASSELRKTGTWRAALPEYSNIVSPCRQACPVGGRIAEWVGQIGAGDIEGAWTTLVDNNPFPSIAGRICHHPCETSCNRVELDETVSICALERFAGDQALSEGWVFPAPPKERDDSVAIIGGGPAGLSAAYQLRRLGFVVHLYEASDQLGGLLRYGVPAYRLDKAVLDQEINRIVAMGVHLHLGTEISDAAALKALRGEHGAVFLASGASRPKALPGIDYGKPYVIDSANYLAETNAGREGPMGHHLVVIGGGSAAMDVARTARRLGRRVSVLSLEPDHLLPAQRAEVDEAKEEGVTFISGAMLQNLQEGPGGLTLECVKVDFKPGAKRGAFSVEPLDDSSFTLAADLVVPAIGQDVDLARWATALTANGPLLGADRHWQTSMEGVFVGGDAASMDRFVTEAIGMGKEAALAIAAFIDGKLAKPAGGAKIAGFDTINTAYHPRAARHLPEHAAPAARLKSFGEVQYRLSADAALDEAKRCFSCGTCTYCDNCYFYCPDMAITRLGDGYEVNADYCKGCGLCVAECPTGSVRMQEDVSS